MNPVLEIPYRATVAIARALSSVTPPGTSKAARALRARRGITRRYANWAASNRDLTRPLLWIHAPSVGEGLQALPVIEEFRSRHPDVQIAYTFFSPSAEQFAQRVGADFTDYLPFDTAGSATAVLDALQPAALVFSKLDVWPLLVEAAFGRSVKLGMFSATLSASSMRRSRIARLALADSYRALDAVGAVSDDDRVRLIETGVRADRLSVTGDTRYDQAWAKAAAETEERRLLLGPLRASRLTVVAGSTWPSDEEHLLPAWISVRAARPNARLLIAPHELSEKHSMEIETWARSNGMISARVGSEAAARADVVIVDRYGILGELYALADIAYVGGGFRKAGLHSLLEPAAFGAPVLIGPRHTDNRDATALIAAGGAFRAADAESMADRIRGLSDSRDSLRVAGAAACEVVRSGLGAAEKSVALVESLVFARQRPGV